MEKLLIEIPFITGDGGIGTYDINVFDNKMECLVVWLDTTYSDPCTLTRIGLMGLLSTKWLVEIRELEGFLGGIEYGAQTQLYEQWGLFIDRNSRYD